MAAQVSSSLTLMRDTGCAPGDPARHSCCAKLSLPVGDLFSEDFQLSCLPLDEVDFNRRQGPLLWACELCSSSGNTGNTGTWEEF